MADGPEAQPVGHAETIIIDIDTIDPSSALIVEPSEPTKVADATLGVDNPDTNPPLSTQVTTPFVTNLY